MNEIRIPYHLAIPATIAFMGLLTILFLRKQLFTDNKHFWISVTVFLAVYMFIVGIATYDDIYYQWDLNRYDLDRDGFFGGEEITKEQEAAQQRLTSGVGRDLSFITGLIFATIISGMTYTGTRIISRLRGQ